MPSHAAGVGPGSCALVCAVGDSLVLYDGGRLLQCVDPSAPDSAWTEFGDLAADRVVALTSCPDLNGHDHQLFAATASGQLLSWTCRSASASTGTSTPNGAETAAGWYPWQPVDLQARPVALAGWSRGLGHQDLVLADAGGDLWARQRSDWDSWSDWGWIGVIPDVRALDALASPNGSVELYAVTTDGELKRKTCDSPAVGTGSWSGVEILPGWTEPALAVACWSLREEAENQAVLLSSGTLQQRWRRPGSVEWSEWWSSPPAPVADLAATLAGWSTSDGRQVTAALGSAGQLSLRPWMTEGGWRSWLPATQVTSQFPTAILRIDHSGNDRNHRDDPRQHDNRHQDDGHDDLGDDRGEAGSHRGPVDDQPLTDPDRYPPDLDSPDPRPTYLPPPNADPTAVIDADRAQEISRAEEATVLFAGRQLLPLQPDDPAQIGPFKLQRRIAGGQASTDKFVARNGRGYCFLKVLRPEASEEEGIAFRRESAMAQRVVDRHRLANFIAAYPGDDEKPAYLALSFEQGKHLGEVCVVKPLASEELVTLARSLLEALVELRACQIRHLDIKPSNVIMRNGDYPVVVDYGSAVSAETTEVLEAAFGTAGYAAPEFVSQRAVNPTTDTYSWGAVLIAAATGSAPARDPQQRTDQLARLPQQLSKLVSDALAEEPVNRPTLDDAVRQLTRTQALGQLGVGIGQRLPVDGLTMIARAEPSAVSPRHLVRRLGELERWQYRVGAGAAAVTGILLGFLVGVFLVQLLRSI